MQCVGLTGVDLTGDGNRGFERTCDIESATKTRKSTENPIVEPWRRSNLLKVQAEARAVFPLGSGSFFCYFDSRKLNLFSTFCGDASGRSLPDPQFVGTAPQLIALGRHPKALVSGQHPAVVWELRPLNKN